MLCLWLGGYGAVCAAVFAFGLLCGHGIPTFLAWLGAHNPDHTLTIVAVCNLCTGVFGALWPMVVAALRGAYSLRSACCSRACSCFLVGFSRMMWIEGGRMPQIDARGGIGLDSEQKVYHFLRSQIATQALLPGAQIVEGQVVEQTGLSRTPVRAALRRLAYEGMVVLRPNRGTFVAKPTPKEVRDTYEALLVLETQAIELACEIISDEDIARLRQLVEESKSIFQRHDFDVFLDNNRNFHMGYVVSCRNKFLEKYIGELIVMSNIHLLVYDDFSRNPL